MRPLPLLLTLAALLTPLAAHADALDDFTVIGNGNTIDFALPATQTFINHPHIVYLGYVASGSVNGVAGSTVDATFFAPPAFFGTGTLGYSSPNGTSSFVTFYGASPISVTYYPAVPPYTNPYGTLTNTFVPGSYDLFTFDFMTGIRTPYTLTITPEAATATPEPATLALLATGTLGLLAAIRLRG